MLQRKKKCLGNQLRRRNVEIRSLPMDTGILYRTHDSNAPPFPEAGTDVTITSSTEVEEFRGRVILAQRSVLTIEVVRYDGVGTLVMAGRTGRFIFNNPSTRGCLESESQKHDTEQICMAWLTGRKGLDVKSAIARSQMEVLEEPVTSDGRKAHDTKSATIRSHIQVTGRARHK